MILLVIWAVYAYRNIWPLATYNLAPLDVDEGVLLWVKVVLLTLVAIALPLVSTRRAPLGVPQWDARPEQTASILSIITFSWLNPLIDHAQKVKHVSLDELPPLAEYNSIEELAEVYYKVGRSLPHCHGGTHGRLTNAMQLVCGSYASSD